MNTVASLPAKWREEASPKAARLLHPDACAALCEAALELEAALASPAPSVTDLDAMVSRFLGWKLPDDFAPDGGISFTPSPIQSPGNLHWPVGTNLLNDPQARAMFEHCAGTQSAVDVEGPPNGWSGLRDAALQHPAAPSVSPAVEGGLLDYVRATYQQIGDALKEHRKDDPFVLVDPVALLGWHNAIAKFAGRLATPEQPGSAVQGEALNYTDIANRAQEITGRSIYPSTAEAVLKAAGFAAAPGAAAGVDEGDGND